MTKTVVQIFLKAPELGKVKTRLIPDLGVEGATAIHRKLVAHVLSVVSSANVDQVQCWVSGDLSHPFITSLGQTYSVHEQVGNDLGEKMHHALMQGMQDYEQVVLIGADAYSVDTDYIQNAFNSLNQIDVVLGPALDGGYILIGVTNLRQYIFSDIEWGTSKVLEQQLQCLDQFNIAYKLLEERWDIDEFSDIQKYAPELVSP